MPNEITIKEGTNNIVIQNAQSGRDIIINKTPEEIVKFLSENNNLQKEYITILKEIRDGLVEKKEEKKQQIKKMEKENEKKATENNNEQDKKKYYLKEVILTLAGILGLIALIKVKSLGNVDIPYFGILFFVILIPIIISFIVSYRRKEKKSYHLGIVALYYSIIGLFIFFFTSTFFNWPKDLCEYPFIECKNNTVVIDTNTLKIEEKYIIKDTNSINNKNNTNSKIKADKISNKTNKIAIQKVKIINSYDSIVIGYDVSIEIGFEIFTKKTDSNGVATFEIDTSKIIFNKHQLYDVNGLNKALFIQKIIIKI